MSEPKRRSQEQIINDLHELVRQIENEQRMKERKKKDPYGFDSKVP
jgi:hypothetical protein